MIKVEHTRFHNISAKFAKIGVRGAEDVEGYDTLVIEGKCVLVKVEGKDAWFFKDNEGKLQHHDGYGGEPREYCKPIIVSETEKIDFANSIETSLTEVYSCSNVLLKSVQDESKVVLGVPVANFDASSVKVCLG